MQQQQSSSTGSLTRLFKVKLCTACVSPLGRILSRGGVCRQCGLRVCKNCRHYDVSGPVSSQQSNWICILCSGSPPNYNNTGSLPKSSMVGKSATKSIRRSWTISNPQRGSGQQNSPILKSYTIYSENNVVTNTRQFNSLPRLTSYGQSVQDENQPVMKSSEELEEERKQPLEEISYSTLHPFKNNSTKSNSNSSVNNLELFWDYYDFSKSKDRVDNIIDSTDRSANSTSQSNRSSCERSLGETEYCCYNIINPVEQSQNNNNNRINNNSQVIVNSNGSIDNKALSTTTTTTNISPVKPERANKRSNSLNSYDGKKLSFSPLRTYVVLRQQQPVSTKKRSSSFNLDYCGGKRNRANSSSNSYNHGDKLDDGDFQPSLPFQNMSDSTKRPFSENQLNCQINRPLKGPSNSIRNSSGTGRYREPSESDIFYIKEPLDNLKRSVLDSTHKINSGKSILDTSTIVVCECESNDPFNTIPKRKSKINGEVENGEKSSLRISNVENSNSPQPLHTTRSPLSKQAKYFHHHHGKHLDNSSSSNHKVDESSVQCSKVSSSNGLQHRIVKPPRKILANKLPSSFDESTYYTTSGVGHNNYNLVSTTLPKSYKSRPHGYKKNVWEQSTEQCHNNNVKSVDSTTTITTDPVKLENLLKKSEKILNPGLNTCVVQINQTFPRRKVDNMSQMKASKLYNVESSESEEENGGGWEYRKGGQQVLLCQGENLRDNHLIVFKADDLNNKFSHSSPYARAYDLGLNPEATSDSPRIRSSNEFVTTVLINNDMCQEEPVVLNPILRIYQTSSTSSPTSASLINQKSSNPSPLSIDVVEKNQNNYYNKFSRDVDYDESYVRNIVKPQPSVFDGVEQQSSDFVTPQSSVETNEKFFDVQSNSHATTTTTCSNVDDTIRCTKSTTTSSSPGNDHEFVNLSSNDLPSPIRNYFDEESVDISKGEQPKQQSLNQYYFERDSASASTENSSDDTIIDCSQLNSSKKNNSCSLIELQNNFVSSGGGQLIKDDNVIVEDIKEFLNEEQVEKPSPQQEFDTNSTSIAKVPEDGDNNNIIESFNEELAIVDNNCSSSNWGEGIDQQLPPIPFNVNVVVDLKSEKEQQVERPLGIFRDFKQLCDNPDTSDNENLLLHIFQCRHKEPSQIVEQQSRPDPTATTPFDISNNNIAQNHLKEEEYSCSSSREQYLLGSQETPLQETSPVITTSPMTFESVAETTTKPNHHHFFNNDDRVQQQDQYNKNHISMNVMMEHNERLTPEGQESITDDSSNTTKRSSPDGEAIIPGMSKLEDENFQVTSSDSDDNSWAEEIPYEEGPPPLDLTLHTIVEESCEESCDETESLKLGQSSSSRKPVVDDLENYFIYLDPASESRKLANEDSEFSDTFSESSFNSEVQHLSHDPMMMIDPVDLASTRLEKYFTNLSQHLSYNNNTEPYSEDSVGSESESDDHIKDKKKKVLKHKRSSNVSDDESIFDLDEGNFDTIKKLPKKKVTEKQQHHHSQSTPPQTTTTANVTEIVDGGGGEEEEMTPLDDDGMDYGSGSSGAFPTTGSNTTTKSKQVHRSNSFQWSSDEEVNLMVTRLRHLIKNLMQKNQTTSIESNSQLRYFETELIRLMRSEPELKNIVSEYISSEESDDNEFNQFIKDVVEQQQQEPNDEYKNAPSSSSSPSWNYKSSVNATSTTNGQQQPHLTLGPESSPALIAKVMHHIGKRLSDWMKDEEEEDGTLKCAPSVSSDLNEDRFSWKGSFESTLAAKRQSVGSTDSISSSDFNPQLQANGGVDRSILRSSSLHHLANSQPIEEKKEEEENISNSLPRLNQMSNMSRAQSTKEIRVKSARYRPPGFTQVPSIIKQIDDKMFMSTPAINVHQESNPDTPLNLRSSADSISSMFEQGTGRINVRGQIEFSLQYNYKLASLEVRIKQCRDLAETKRNRSDPYVKAYLLPDRTKSGKRKTKTKKNTLNPIFEETLKFPLTLSELQSRTLWVSVWHSDIFGKNEFLGQVLISLKDRVFDDTNSLWWRLEEMSVVGGAVEDQSRGELILALKWQPRGENRGSLSILVKEAKNIYLLPTKNGCPSTFVKCSPLKEVNKNHRTKQKTSIARRTLHPVWNQTLYFSDIPDDGVEVSLWNYDLLSNHDLIGSIKLDYSVPLWESMLNRHSFWVEGVLPLSKLDNGNHS